MTVGINPKKSKAYDTIAPPVIPSTGVPKILNGATTTGLHTTVRAPVYGSHPVSSVGIVGLGAGYTEIFCVLSRFALPPPFIVSFTVYSPGLG